MDKNNERLDKNKERDMEMPKAVSREAWLRARKELLVKEKGWNRQRDALNAERRRLPMVRIDKDYVFEGPNGKASLLDLFEGRRQLIIYHFMFDPNWDDGCPDCSFQVDNVGHLAHLQARKTSLALASRAPLAKIEPFQTRIGWRFKWVSSFGSDFNSDFRVSFSKEQLASGGELYNFGTIPPYGEENHGLSVFYKDPPGAVFHTYSTYGRGCEPLVGTYNYLDLTPLGRQEDWEEPPGRSDSPFLAWVRRHDEYDNVERSESCCGSATHQNPERICS